MMKFENLHVRFCHFQSDGEPSRRHGWIPHGRNAVTVTIERSYLWESCLSAPAVRTDGLQPRAFRGADAAGPHLLLMDRLLKQQG